jgi:hypothetical protein
VSATVPDVIRECVLRVASSLLNDYSGTMSDADRRAKDADALEQVATQLAHLTALVEQGARLETPCVWSYDGGEYAYKGDCGVYFQFTEGGTAENGFKFCHACGRPVEDSSLWPDPIDEDADEAIDAAR